MGIAIVGMHRSGTSAVGRLLSGLGLGLGLNGTPFDVQAENPRGHYERYDVTALNDRWLTTLGGTWWAPPRTHDGTWGQLDTQQIRRDRAALDILSPDHPPWFVKDPRISLLLPLWDRLALHRLPAVLVLRDPRECASSVMLRDGFAERRALVIWYAYVHRAASSMLGRELLVLDYESLLADPVGSAKALASFVADTVGVDGGAVDIDAVAGLIEGNLQRQRPASGGTVSAEHAADCMDLYRMLAVAHAQRELPHRALPAVPRWIDAALDELNELYTVRAALEEAERERDDLARAFDGGLRTTIGMARDRRSRRPLDP